MDLIVSKVQLLLCVLFFLTIVPYYYPFFHHLCLERARCGA